MPRELGKSVCSIKQTYSGSVCVAHRELQSHFVETMQSDLKYFSKATVILGPVWWSDGLGLRIPGFKSVALKSHWGNGRLEEW